MELTKHGPGRPQKFGRPSRVVTVTLPEDVLTRLDAVDADLGRAIVALVERKGARLRAVKLADIAVYGTHSVIVVTPVNALKRIAGVQLIPVGNGRALISLKPPHSIAELELGLGDALEQNGLSARERSAIAAIADIIRRARRSRRVVLDQRTIIVLEAKRQRRSA